MQTNDSRPVHSAVEFMSAFDGFVRGPLCSMPERDPRLTSDANKVTCGRCRDELERRESRS